MSSLGNRSATARQQSLCNHNVLLTLIVRAADGLSAGIWNGATLAAYIYLIQHNSNKVPVSCLAIQFGTLDVLRAHAPYAPSSHGV